MKLNGRLLFNHFLNSGAGSASALYPLVEAQAYSLHLYAYADAGIEKETAEEWAKKTCDLLIGK